VSQSRTRQRRMHSFAAAVALGLALLGQTAARGQDVVRRALLKPGNSQPIQLYADNIATWTEAGRRVFLLQGQVWIEQGSLNLRMPQGVVWVDEKTKQTSGVYNLDVYGEGGVALDTGADQQAPPTALLQLATRGEVRIKAYGGQVAQQVLTNEPMFQRARAAKGTQPAVANPRAQNPVQAALPTPPAQLTKDVQAAPLSPPPAASPSPGATGIQQVQALQPAPSVVPPPPPPPVAAPEEKPPPLPPANAPPKRFSIRSRTSLGINAQGGVPQPDGTTPYVIPTGVIITVGDPGDPKGFLDIEADRAVVWTKGSPQQMFANMQSSHGETTNSVEFYLTGNVEIRSMSHSKTGSQSQVLRADEVYYDVGRNVAIALKSDLELRDPKVPNPIHFHADEFFRINATLYQTNQMEIYSTVLPSDPGLKIELRQATIEERDTQKKTIFGVGFTKRDTGEPLEEKEHYVVGRDLLIRLEGVPIFYFPWFKGLAEDPLGPLDSVSIGYNRAFGATIFSTWDIFELIGVQRPENTRWHLMLDVLTQRGPAMGTEFQAAGKNLFGIENKYEAHVLAWGLHDAGTDLLGGNRGVQAFLGPGNIVPITPPEWRGRFLGQLNVQELPAGFTVQTQAALLSDRNFLEQYYKGDFDSALNQETFLYVKQQQDRWAWTALVEPRVRSWVTETEWLPRGDGYVIGQKFFDLFTYNVHASAGYAMLRPDESPPLPYAVTDQATNTGRFDIMQELSLPFQAGPFKIVPYAKFDLAYYTADLDGDSQGRIYGGPGVRASIPFSKLYPCVDSDLFNLNGIYHKIVLSGNWFWADSNTRMTTLPQLDRFNDDTSDQALRDMRPFLPVFYPANAKFLMTPLFDPQFYALRRLVDTNADTLDRIDVIQLDLRQRWQTKRGMPGDQHIVDWMTLDVGMSIFPQSNRDNFGEPLGILNYDWTWNIGDRTALVSDGWFETISGGPRVWNAGAVLSRPDNSSFYLGYRQIDPLNSKAVVASVSYAFSPKYAATASTVWDFGINNQSYAFMLTRLGTDLRVSFGISYNSIVNSFGVQFEIVPNLVGNSKHNAFSPTMLGSNGMAGHH
jgi:hypothetical protein